ncbi:uncharacterized protein [Maniola hyperantus]|uniref:uncharacterized protein n=1 Tax=Aphantopus hyperantus TaxID=2795564 RepID=UPI0015698BB7|nr:uncharacterized protein LOC117990793 [Maniola hyperantus]
MDSKNPHPPEIKEWSDIRCLKIASQDQFPAAVKDLKVQRNIISRYLNFYLGGKIQKGLNARDLTLAVVAIMPISSSSEEFIWPESEYGENGNLFFLTPHDKLKYDLSKVFEKRAVEKDPEDDNSNGEEVDNQADTDVDAYMNKEDITNNNSDTDHDSENEEETSSNKETTHETHDQRNGTSTSRPSSSKPVPSITALQWYRPKRPPINVTPSEETTYGPVENANFCTACNRLLEAWDHNVTARISLKYFFAMAALFVMRAKAKTFHNLTKYFSKRIFNNYFLRELNHYTPPHRGFLKKSWKAFRETDTRNQVMFAKLVITSLMHPTRLSNFEKQNIIKYAVLSHIAYFGMGIINMLQQLAIFTDSEFKILFKSLYSEETAASWNRVNDFFKKYLNKEAKQYTIHWAGVIESESVKQLSCSNNYELAVVIAVFVEKLTNNSGVWQSAWVGKGSRLDKCKQLGCKLYNDYQELSKEQTLFSDTEMLQKILGGIISSF